MDADTLSYLVERYPLLITNLLTHPHLLELLDQAVNRSLVLITAPAVWHLGSAIRT
jgi:hypothetical protein